MSSIAFAQRADSKDVVVGVLPVGDSSIHVAEELKNGGGQIVVDASNTVLVSALDACCPPLERVEPKSKKKADKAAKEA